MRPFALLLAAAQYSHLCLAAAIDRDLYEASGLSIFSKRDDASCGGQESLSQCGEGFPSSFCCPHSTTCVSLNANDTTAAICCPEGVNCDMIQITSCDKKLLDSISHPSSSVHASPAVDMLSCGSQCCPPGYECDAVQTVCRLVAPDAGESLTTMIMPSATSTTPITATSSGTASEITVIPTASSHAESDTSQDPVPSSKDEGTRFSGKSFAAGFVPGIFLGLLAAAIIIWIVIRRKRRGDTYVENEKRDTLTPVSRQSSVSHLRSISDPIARQSHGHRTEFSRGQSPPRLPMDAGAETVQVHGAKSPYSPPILPKIRPLFSRSPMMTPKPTQSPLPQHCNRGTINWSKGIPALAPSKSFHISPIRGLNRKQSVNSLRRHARNASQASDASTRRLTNTTQLNRNDSEASTGTINLAFPEAGKYASPDMRVQPHHTTSRTDNPSDMLGSSRYQPPAGGFTPAAASSVYPEDEGYHGRPYTTAMIPPPIPLHVTNSDLSNSSSSSGSSTFTTARNAPHLGSPYTPTKKQASNTVGKATRMLGGVGGGLTVQREPVERAGPSSLGVPETDNGRDARRDTTFSQVMRKAGVY